MDVLNQKPQTSPCNSRTPSIRPPIAPSLFSNHIGLIISISLLALAFSTQIFAWIRYGSNSDKFSYILLIPIISAYFFWTERKTSTPVSKRSPVVAILFGLIGAALLIPFFRIKATPSIPPNDFLFFSITALVSFLVALVALFKGASFLRIHLFPLALLFLCAPFPEAAVDRVETFLQAGSADVTAILFTLLQTPYLREGTFFQLPGLAIRVAQECSGIHSTLVLFITGILATRLLLRSTWARSIVLASLLPLALVRNAIRIVTISLLTIYYDPGIIHGPLHKRGGPVFFVMSLVILLALLLLLRRFEKRPLTTDHRLLS